MAKYYGVIGYAAVTEQAKGVFVEQIEEHPYVGDIVRNMRRLQTSGNVNDNVNMSMQISIIADPFARDNFQNIRYATYANNKWKVESVEVNFPRLILSLGGLYNE